MIHSSIVTAFSIAAALIWKDVIIDTIKALVPASEQLLVKFIAAILATILVILAMYIILKAEEANLVFSKLKKK